MTDASEATDRNLLPFVNIRAPRKPKDINSALMAGVDAYGSSDSTISVLVGDVTVTLSDNQAATLQRDILICEGNRSDIAGGATDLRKSLGTLLVRAMKGDKRLMQPQPSKAKVVKSSVKAVISKKRPRESTPHVDAVAVVAASASASVAASAIPVGDAVQGDQCEGDVVEDGTNKNDSAAAADPTTTVAEEDASILEIEDVDIDEEGVDIGASGGASAETVETDPWTCITTDNEMMTTLEEDELKEEKKKKKSEDKESISIIDSRNMSASSIETDDDVKVVQEIVLASASADALSMCDLLSVSHGNGGTGVGPLLSSPSPAPALQYLLAWSDAGRAVNLFEENDLWRRQLHFPGPSQLSRLRMDMAGCDNVRLTASITSGPSALSGSAGCDYKNLLSSLPGTRNMLDYGTGEFEEAMEGGSGDVYDDDMENEQAALQAEKRPLGGLSAFGFGPVKDSSSRDVLVLSGSSSGDEGYFAPLTKEPSFSMFGGGGVSRFDRARREKQAAAAAAFNPEKDDPFIHSAALHVSVSVATTAVTAEMAMDISTAILILSDSVLGKQGASNSPSSSLRSLFMLQAMSTTLRHASSVMTTALLRQTTPSVVLSARALSASSGHAPSVRSCQGSGSSGALSSGIDRMACLRSLARSEIRAYNRYKKELADAEAAAVAEAAAAAAAAKAANDDDDFIGMSSTFQSRRRTLRSTSTRLLNKEIKKKVGPEPPQLHLARIIEWTNNEDNSDNAYSDILMKTFFVVEVDN
jgi:hypothetical protein